MQCLCNEIQGNIFQICVKFPLLKCLVKTYCIATGWSVLALWFGFHYAVSLFFEITSKELVIHALFCRQVCTEVWLRSFKQVQCQ